MAGVLLASGYRGGRKAEIRRKAMSHGSIWMIRQSLDDPPVLVGLIKLVRVLAAFVDLSSNVWMIDSPRALFVRIFFD